ncbi:hypothetical protein [Burkholderia pseudomallei]|uniref:hypothetical protein n=1 Tax=Burkholderia pseudomallei TaxID=28450 RepID=UPI0004AE76B9
MDEIETRRFCRCAIAVTRRTPRRTRRTRRPTALRRAGSTDRLDPAGPAHEGGQAQRSCKAATRHPRAEPSGESETTAAHTRIQFPFRRIFATQISDNPEKAAKLTSAFIIGQRFRF